MRKLAKKLLSAIMAIAVAVCMTFAAYAVTGSVNIFSGNYDSLTINGVASYGPQNATATTSMSVGFCNLSVQATCYFYNNMGVVSSYSDGDSRTWYSVTVSTTSYGFNSCGVASYHSATAPDGQGNGFGLSEGRKN